MKTEMTVTSDRDTSTSRAFAFGPFTFIPERQLLLRGNTPVRIGGRALDILTALVERPGELVSKRELMARVWPKTVVDEGSLKVNVAALRRAMSDGGLDDGKYIIAVVGRGYQFIPPVMTSAWSDSAPATDSTSRQDNLPTGTTRIVGRADAITAIRRELHESRLVSVVGAGGIGKTTVALAVAEHELGLFKHGVWLVDLGLLRDQTLTAHAIATAMGVGAHSENMLVPLCEFLRDRDLLLVMDNCEHVIEAVASCANRILSEAAGVKILVTSREPLLVKQERVHRLPGLDTPPPCASLSAREALTFAAIQLFVDRATDRVESFKLSDAEAPTVADICRKLDGLALAIEFAATRIDGFGTNGLLTQLDQSFRHFVGRRAGPARQRTLAATLDWSYGLLSAHEAALLRAVSAFAGVFDIDGASAVLNAAPAEAADTLARLAEKSLLATDVDAVGVAYRLLETTRMYCLEKLVETGEDQAVRQRHAEYVCALLERAASEWGQRLARDWGATYGTYLDDLRAALAWTTSEPTDPSLQIRLTAAGTLLWNHFSLTDESRTHLARAIIELGDAGFEDTAVEMNLQFALAGAILYTRGATPEAREAIRRALQISERLGDTDFHLRCLRLTGSIQLFFGEHDAGIRTLETFLSIATSEEPSALAEGETHLGVGQMFVGRIQYVRSRMEHLNAQLSQDFNDARFARFQVSNSVSVLVVLSHAQYLTGSLDAAAQTAQKILEYGRLASHELSLSNALAWNSLTHLLLGREDDCSRQAAMLDELIERHGIVNWRPVATFCRGALAARRHPESPNGIDDLKRTVAECRAIGHMARLPFYIAVLAQALAQQARFQEAEATIREAEDLAAVQNEKWCLPEILRIHAFIAQAQGQHRNAESLLQQSIAVAQEIGALTWQLRASNDLAVLWRAQSRTAQAKRLLKPVFDAFSEGFETQDLVAAARLLAELE